MKKPNHQALWPEAVAKVGWNFLDPGPETAPFLTRGSNFVILGDTFAEAAGRWLGTKGYRTDGNGISAELGRLYTPRQLRQWLEMAAGELNAEGRETVWEHPSGRYLDAFRPTAAPPGETAGAVFAERRRFLARLRSGLAAAEALFWGPAHTEVWLERKSGLAFPLPPEVLKKDGNPSEYEARALTGAETARDLAASFRLLGRLNPALKIIFAVSPVPLYATVTGRHALTADSLAKSTLASAGLELEKRPRISYFPAFELLRGLQAPVDILYEPDLRTVKEAGIGLVMKRFLKHFAADWREDPGADYQLPAAPVRICDDVFINPIG